MKDSRKSSQAIFKNKFTSETFPGHLSGYNAWLHLPLSITMPSRSTGHLLTLPGKTDMKTSI